VTREEYEQQQREMEMLVNQINRLIAENNRLREQIAWALSNMKTVRNNIINAESNIKPVIRNSAQEVDLNKDTVKDIHDALNELSTQYFSFKAMSTAAKNLSQYNDEFFTRFSYYEKLRRITLGYVIGLDSNFITNEAMRDIVEKAYLQNTDYWLAYCIMAVMLWASDEPEAANRALGKSLQMNAPKASLFYMLVNLRFAREKVAQKWFIYYLEHVNAMKLGNEWQYLLYAFLSGAFGADPQFQELAEEKIKSMFDQAMSQGSGIGQQCKTKAKAYMSSYLHHTENVFPYLKSHCKEYDAIMALLSHSEKNAVLAQYYDELSQEEIEDDGTISQRIENVLYALISSYDADEMALVKKIKENEAIIAANGNVSMAQKRVGETFSGEETDSFANMLIKWAFCENSKLTPLLVRKFAITFLKDWISEGYESFAEEYRKREKIEYMMDIDGYEIECNENSPGKSKSEISKKYAGQLFSRCIKDKNTLIFGAVTGVGLLALIITAFLFNPISLTIGILLVVAGSFLLWRNIDSVKKKHIEDERQSLMKLSHVIEELAEWRQAYHQEDAKFTDLSAALEKFEA